MRISQVMYCVPQGAFLDPLQSVLVVQENDAKQYWNDFINGVIPQGADLDPTVFMIYVVEQKHVILVASI